MFQSPMWTHFDVYTSKSGIYAKNSCLALLSSRSRRSRLPASQARITPVDKRRGQTSCGRDGRSQSMQILLLLHVQGTGTVMHKKACPGFLENGQIITEHSIIDPRGNIGFTNRKHGKDNPLTQLTGRVSPRAPLHALSRQRKAPSVRHFVRRNFIVNSLFMVNAQQQSFIWLIFISL